MTNYEELKLAVYESGLDQEDIEEIIHIMESCDDDELQEVCESVEELLDVVYESLSVKKTNIENFEKAFGDKLQKVGKFTYKLSVGKDDHVYIILDEKDRIGPYTNGVRIHMPINYLDKSPAQIRGIIQHEISHDMNDYAYSTLQNKNARSEKNMKEVNAKSKKVMNALKNPVDDPKLQEYTDYQKKVSNSVDKLKFLNDGMKNKITNKIVSKKQNELERDDIHFLHKTSKDRMKERTSTISDKKRDDELRKLFSDIIKRHKETGEPINEHLTVNELMADFGSAEKNGIDKTIAMLTNLYQKSVKNTDPTTDKKISDDEKRLHYASFNEYKIRIEALRKAQKYLKESVCSDDEIKLVIYESGLDSDECNDLISIIEATKEDVNRYIKSGAKNQIDKIDSRINNFSSYYYDHDPLYALVHRNILNGRKSDYRSVELGDEDEFIPEKERRKLIKSGVKKEYDDKKAEEKQKKMKAAEEYLKDEKNSDVANKIKTLDSDLRKASAKRDRLQTRYDEKNNKNLRKYADAQDKIDSGDYKIKIGGFGIRNNKHYNKRDERSEKLTKKYLDASERLDGNYKKRMDQIDGSIKNKKLKNDIMTKRLLEGKPLAKKLNK